MWEGGVGGPQSQRRLTSSTIGPLSFLGHMVLATSDPELYPTPKSQNSPVLLPRVTSACVGLPKLSGKHPDDVDEEDEVELWREAAMETIP